MDILSRIMAIASLFFVVTIGIQVYPMDPASAYPAQDYEFVTSEAESFGFAQHEITAKMGDQALGSVIFQYNYPSVIVEVLFVEPAHRRKGIAGALMARVEEFARANACIQMRLKATPLELGLTSAQRVERCLLLKAMYEKCGFKAIGNVSGESPITMVKRLS